MRSFMWIAGSVAVIIALIVIFGLSSITNLFDGMESSEFRITSSAFGEGERIPQKYTCDGENISPPLAIEGVPEGTQSLVLIMEDPDVPQQLRPDGLFTHWVVVNMPSDTKKIEEGATPPGAQGPNGAGALQYTGPCPPPQFEPAEHRYFFNLYALDAVLPQEGQEATREALLAAFGDHVIATTTLIGRYERAQ